MTLLLDRPTSAEEELPWDRDAKPSPDLKRQMLIYLNDGPTRFEGLSHRSDWSGLRVLVYARISNDPKWLRMGTRRQVERCVATAENRGAAVVGTYIDDDISASTFSRKKRPAFNDMMRRMMAGDADVVLAVDADRLYRRLAEFAPILELFAASSADFAVVCLEGDFDLTTSDGRFIAGMKVLLAQKEAETISKRIKNRNLATITDGKPLGTGRRAFGWEVDGKTPREAEVRLLQEAWADVLAGVSLRAIGKKWEQARVPGAYAVDRRGNPNPLPRWSRNTGTLKKILTNPRHVGDLKYQGRVLLHSQWSGIISREDYERVCAILKVRGNQDQGVAPAPRRRSEFTGLIRCGRDGAVMHRGTAAGYKVFRCSHEGCSNSVIRDYVEEPLIDRVLDRVESDDFYRQTLARLSEDKSEARAVSALIDARDAKIEEVDALHRDGRISGAAWASQRAHLEADRSQLVDRLTRMVKDRTVASWLDRSATLRDEWATLSVDLKRSVLSAVVDAVVVHPATRMGRGFDPSRLEWRFVD